MIQTGYNGYAPAGLHVVSSRVIFEGKVPMQTAQNGVCRIPVRSKHDYYL
jgi:hypothetical protein